MWEKLKKKLVRWGIKNRSEPTLITALLHIISLWSNGHMPHTPPNVPTQVEADFKINKYRVYSSTNRTPST